MIRLLRLSWCVEPTLTKAYLVESHILTEVDHFSWGDQVQDRSKTQSLTSRTMVPQKDDVTKVIVTKTLILEPSSKSSTEFFFRTLVCFRNLNPDTGFFSRSF